MTKKVLVIEGGKTSITCAIAKGMQNCIKGYEEDREKIRDFFKDRPEQNALNMNNQNDHPAIGLDMAIEPPKETSFVHMDMASGEDFTVEVKGYKKDGKVIITDCKTIERQPDVKKGSQDG